MPDQQVDVLDPKVDVLDPKIGLPRLAGPPLERLRRLVRSESLRLARRGGQPPRAATVKAYGSPGGDVRVGWRRLDGALVDTLGPARLGDVVLDLEVTALSAWLKDPAAK